MNWDQVGPSRKTYNQTKNSFPKDKEEFFFLSESESFP